MNIISLVKTIFTIEYRTIVEIYFAVEGYEIDVIDSNSKHRQ